MKQYLVTGYDHTDEGALDRRLSVRQHHLDGMRALKATGNFILGASILNEEGNMIGSSIVVQFKTEEELEAWKQNEIYITAKVWESVDVKPVRVADV